MIAGCGGTSEAADVHSDASTSDATTGSDASGDTTTGSDAIASDAGPEGSADAPVSECPLPPGDYTSCASDDDCAFVAAGCYCGPQPVYGVSKSALGAVGKCEGEAAANCMLGCMNQPWHVTDDGAEDVDGGAIKVRCVPGDGGAKSCRTYLE